VESRLPRGHLGAFIFLVGWLFFFFFVFAMGWMGWALCWPGSPCWGCCWGVPVLGFPCRCPRCWPPGGPGRGALPSYVGAGMGGASLSWGGGACPGAGFLGRSAGGGWGLGHLGGAGLCSGGGLLLAACVGGGVGGLGTRALGWAQGMGRPWPALMRSWGGASCDAGQRRLLELGPAGGPASGLWGPGLGPARIGRGGGSGLWLLWGPASCLWPGAPPHWGPPWGAWYGLPGALGGGLCWGGGPLGSRYLHRGGWGAGGVGPAGGPALWSLGILLCLLGGMPEPRLGGGTGRAMGGWALVFLSTGQHSTLPWERAASPPPHWGGAPLGHTLLEALCAVAGGCILGGA
jgi:hypothetical protein